MLLLSAFPATAETPEQFHVLAPVVVTANKLEEEADKVPMSMTLFSGDELDESGIRSVDDIFDRVPNLFSTGTMTANVRMMSFRGKTTMSFTEANPLIIYVDGVPMDSYFNADPALLAVERVEVLHGSQSTLYGKSSMGGVMNIITKAPGNTFEVQASGGVGTYETGFFRVEASGPLVRDRLFFSLSTLYDRTDGYMDNPGTDKGNDSSMRRFKAGLRALLPNDFEINLQSDVSLEDRGFDAAIKGPEATLDSDLNPDDFTDAVGVNTSLKVEKDFGAFRGESITTHRYSDMEYEQDFDFLEIGVGASGRHVEDREITQEFRLASEEEDPSAISWIAGIYASDGERDKKDISSYIVAFDMESHLPSTETVNDYAVYGQLTLPLMEKVSLTGALRYQYTEKDIAFRYYTVMGGIRIPGLNAETTDHWDAILPKLALTWQPSEQTMVWGSVSRGFHPGGFNWSSGTPDPSDYTFKEQTSLDYELGLKTTLFNGDLVLNTSLFYADITDLQVVSYDPATFAYIASNAAAATSYGAEVQASLRLNSNWSAGLSCALTQAEFDSYTGTDSAGPFDYSGNKVPYTPDLTLGGYIRYIHDNGWTARASVRHLGKLYWDDANSTSRGGTTLVGGRIGYESGNWGAFVTCDNLLDERYLDYLQPATNYALVAPPRTVGLQVNVKL